MFQVDRNALGLTQVTYITGTRNPVKETVTVLGKGLIDRIALVILRFLGQFLTELKPIRFTLSHSKDRFQFPNDMFITRSALKSLLGAESKVWSEQKEIPLIQRTTDIAINEAIEKIELHVDDDNYNFLDSTHIFHTTLNSTLNRRMNALELFISEHLDKMDAFTGEFVLPLDPTTGEILDREQRVNGAECYLARIQIKEVNLKNGEEVAEETGEKVRIAKFLKEVGTDKEPNLSSEAAHVLTEVIENQLKVFIKEPLTLKQVAKRLQDEVFGRKYMELGEIPIFDRSEDTKVILNPADNEFEIYELANHITLGEKKYIATAYPLLDDLWKFWEMIFETKSPVIVKLNDAKKNSNPEKDSSYWPGPNEIFDYPSQEIKVVNVKETEIADCLFRREFEITKHGQTHKVIQIDFIGWPDKSTPNPEHFQKVLFHVNAAYEETQKVPAIIEEKAKSVISSSDGSELAVLEENVAAKISEDLEKKSDLPVLESPKELEKTPAKEMIASTPIIKSVLPITVHCVAGKGRTGTFIGTHSSLGIKDPDHIKLLYEMRKQRSARMVETVEQFKFMKDTVELFNKGQ